MDHLQTEIDSVKTAMENGARVDLTFELDKKDDAEEVAAAYATTLGKSYVHGATADSEFRWFEMTYEKGDMVTLSVFYNER